MVTFLFIAYFLKNYIFKQDLVLMVEVFYSN